MHELKTLLVFLMVWPVAASVIPVSQPLLAASESTRPAPAAVPAPPEPISPGAKHASLPSADCPTFSWSAEPGASSFELEVFEIVAHSWSHTARDAAPRDAANKPLWSERIEGDARSFTPARDACPSRGVPVVWRVRAERDGQVSAWSPALSFRVAPRTQSSASVRDLLQRSLLESSARSDSLDDASAGAAAPAAEIVSTAERGAMPPGMDVPRRLVVNELIVGPALEGPAIHITSADSSAPRLVASRAPVLRAPRLSVRGATGADFYTNSQALVLAAEGESIAGPRLDLGEVLAVDWRRPIISFTGDFRFNGTSWKGTGGSGYFAVPALVDATVDDNASSCPDGLAVGVRLRETDSEQIGIQILCTEQPQ